MKYIGIKLADGSFYPVLEEGKAAEKLLDLTTVQDNQTTVQIDLYRTATSSMDDAEYVDTLEIKNLKPHPNGEPDLQLKVSLDENNELNAEVADPETGKKSETQVTLVSRTLAERESTPVNFSIDEPEPEPTVLEEPPLVDDNTLVDSFVSSEVATDPTLSDGMAAETAAIEETIDPTLSDDTAAETADEEKIDLFADDIDIPVAEPEVAADDDALSDDTTLSDEELASIQKNADVLNSEEETADTVAEDTDVISPSPNNEDFSFDDLTTDSSATEVTKKDELNKTQDFSPSEFDISDFEKAVAEETLGTSTVDETTATVEKTEEPVEETVEEPVIEEKNSTDDLDLTLPDFDNLESTGAVADVPDFAATSVPEETIPEETSVSDVPEIEEKSSAEETKQIFNEADYSVPDFDEPTVTPIPTGLTDYFEDPAFKEDPAFNDTSIDETAEKKPEDDFSIDDTIDNTDNTETDDDRKIKTPVIICIICAIICIIATLLVLFVIPSKINLIKSRNTSTAEVTPAVAPAPVEPEPVPVVAEPEPVAPAVEDTIVVAPTPEVVPEEPPAPVEPPADIKYKIRWGDTLWDISDAYYKNPWRYHKLAKYNHIKNPDLIISGTYILIPAE